MGSADGSIIGVTKILDNGADSARFNVVIVAEGYQAAQLGQFQTDAQNVVNALQTTAPFDHLMAGVNVHRLDVSSTDTGADEPTTCGGSGAAPRTFFDATFCTSGIDRLLTVDATRVVQAVSAHVPAFHVILVIVNTTTYGGSGGSVGVFSLANGALQIALHELGHTAFGLADEYEYWAGCGIDTDRNNHPPGEPSQPNVTLETNRDIIKWRDLILPATPMPTMSNPNCANCDSRPSTVPAGTVGAFEGAHYYHCGAYRPEFNCLMRALGQPLCAVCRRVIDDTLQVFLPIRRVIDNFGYVAGGWRVERHPRFLADLTGDGPADIVGFGNAGVWVALNNGDGTFQPPTLAIENLGYVAGGWRVDRHPRLLADLTGDDRADIVGFGNAGVWVALNNGDGTFQPPTLAIENLGYVAGGWRVDRHPRFLADLTGDRRADIVGFGNAGVWVALNNGDGTFQPPTLAVENLGYVAGGWRVERHPRFLADLTGDGRADIVGFGNAGVWVALNNGDGTFQPPTLAVENFGYVAGGWRVERHPRFLADLTGDGRADIVGFGNAGVWVALNNGDGTFQPPTLAVENLGYDAGSWRVERHPRFLADMTGDGRADLVGFGNAGVWVALNKGDGTFRKPSMIVKDFGYIAGGWRVERHPRFLADLTGDGRADIVGFGDAGVWVRKAEPIG
jgi:hypothetical protein